MVCVVPPVNVDMADECAEKLCESPAPARRRANSCPAVEREDEVAEWGAKDLEAWMPSTCCKPRHNRALNSDSASTDSLDQMYIPTGESRDSQNLSETHLTLPSLVDDKESCCSSADGPATPIRSSLAAMASSGCSATTDTTTTADTTAPAAAATTTANPTRGLNAAAAAFIPQSSQHSRHHAQGMQMHAPITSPLLPVPGGSLQPMPNNRTPASNSLATIPVLLSYNPSATHYQQQDSTVPNMHNAVPQMGTPRTAPQAESFLLSLQTDEPLPWAAIAGRALQVSTTQEGSRILQKSLPVWSPADIEAFFAEVKPHVAVLMHDTTGNYALQRLLEYSTPLVRKGLAGCLRGNMLELSLQPYACRIVQKVLELVDENERIALAGELDGKVSVCVQDQHGNHVVQKFIDIMPQHSSFIVRSFVGRVEEVATHSYGCRVVQRILEKCRDSPEIVQVLEEILFHVQRLSLDQYGNYVVQHVVKHGHPQYQFAITTKLTGRFALMTTHKFASNVVEKMLEAVGDGRDTIVKELLLPSAADQSLSALAVASMDPYGNYVVQKLLDIGTEQQKRTVIEHLRPYLPLLSRSHHAKVCFGFWTNCTHQLVTSNVVQVQAPSTEVEANFHNANRTYNND
ncbi:Pumilio-like protein 5 [Diplonema papillatum]|nr:Pumilio-like protein 5 [Diplonema papillatum]